MSSASRIETSAKLEVFKYLNEESCERIVEFVKNYEDFPRFFVNHGSNHTKKGVKRAEFGDIPDFRELLSIEIPDLVENERLIIVKYMGHTSLAPHVDHTESSPVTSIQLSNGVREIGLYDSTHDEEPIQAEFMYIGHASVLDGSIPHGIASRTDSEQYALLVPGIDIRDH